MPLSLSIAYETSGKESARTRRLKDEINSLLSKVVQPFQHDPACMERRAFLERGEPLGDDVGIGEIGGSFEGLTFLSGARSRNLDS